MLETKTPSSYSWRFGSYILGGPGRNRTTDTRIFKSNLSLTARLGSSSGSLPLAFEHFLFVDAGRLYVQHADSLPEHSIVMQPIDIRN